MLLETQAKKQKVSVSESLTGEKLHMRCLKTLGAQMTLLRQSPVLQEPCKFAPKPARQVDFSALHNTVGAERATRVTLRAV